MQLWPLVQLGSDPVPSLDSPAAYPLVSTVPKSPPPAGPVPVAQPLVKSLPHLPWFWELLICGSCAACSASSAEEQGQGPATAQAPEQGCRPGRGRELTSKQDYWPSRPHLCVTSQPFHGSVINVPCM